MTNLKKIAAGISAAAALGYGVGANAAPLTSPGGVADAYLLISNFTILEGNGAAGKGTDLNYVFAGDPIGGADLVLSAVETNADTSATIGATTNSQSTEVGLGVPFAIQNTSGPNGGLFVPGTTLPIGTMNAGTYAGSATSSFGDATQNVAQPGSSCGAGNVGDCVPVHNQVNIASNTTGSAQANQNLITTFTIVVQNTVTFELNFNADQFLRAALGQVGLGNSANASTSWSATVIDTGALPGSDPVLSWKPNGTAGLGDDDGTCVGAGTCTEFSDPFGLTNNVATTTLAEGVRDRLNRANRTFEVELTLNPGTYTFSIAHATAADAKVNAVPEPGTLALLGAGLVGIAARRRKTA